MLGFTGLGVRGLGFKFFLEQASRVAGSLPIAAPIPDPLRTLHCNLQHGKTSQRFKARLRRRIQVKSSTPDKPIKIEAAERINLKRVPWHSIASRVEATRKPYTCLERQTETCNLGPFTACKHRSSPNSLEP